MTLNVSGVKCQVSNVTCHMILGITGISGTGKHTSAQYFKRKGWVVLDVDKVAHHSYRPYTHVWKAIVREFGMEILNQDDTINRLKLGKIVFNASRPKEADSAIKKLNQIVHPYIKRRLKNEIHRYFRRKSNIVIVAVLWKELDLLNICDKILLIKADKRLSSKRIQKRDQISAEIYKMRVKHQSDPPHPDFVIKNNGTPEELNSKLAELPLGIA